MSNGDLTARKPILPFMTQFRNQNIQNIFPKIVKLHLCLQTQEQKEKGNFASQLPLPPNFADYQAFVVHYQQVLQKDFF